LSTLNRIPGSSLALREPPREEPWRDADWQNLWLALKARPWTSLAVVSAAAGGPPDFSLTIAVTLARIGILHLGAQIHVADATNISLVHLEQFTEEVRRLNQGGELVLVALPPIEKSPVMASVARSASAALLCVLMGEMSPSESKRTVERVGSSHFLGSVVLHSEGTAGFKAVKR
jgi:hypothetical protein